ncbi:hypothetical protein BC937DRAFT_95562, partial [Endogone sp. FLAS-F59071]
MENHRTTRAPPPPPIVTGRPPVARPPTVPATSSVFNLDNYKIVLGYDFGTTYSGCSYAYAQNEEVFDISK